MSDDVLRRLDMLEQQREDDRKTMSELSRDVASLITEMRVTNAYAEKCYKRIDNVEEQRETQNKAIDELSKIVIKNQPAVDSVNKIKAGLWGVLFTVLAGGLLNWLISTNTPSTEKTYNQLIEKLDALGKQERQIEGYKDKTTEQ